MSTRSTIFTEEIIADPGEYFGSMIFIERDWTQIPRRTLGSLEEDGSITIQGDLDFWQS